MTTPNPHLERPDGSIGLFARLFSTPTSADAAEWALRSWAGGFALLAGLLYLVVVVARIGLGAELSHLAGPLFKSIGPVVLVLNALALARSSSRLVATSLLLLVLANAVFSFPAPLPLLLSAVAARITQLAFICYRFASPQVSAAETASTGIS
jgi:hypothetical protein